MNRYVITIFIALAIPGCVSVEELARQEMSSREEHKKIFVECKGRVFAFREWIDTKKALFTEAERGAKTTQTQAKCLEEKLGVTLLERVPTTRLDIQSQMTLRFYTGGDPLLQKYFERARKWAWEIREGGEPWKGFWHEHNEVIDRWRKIYKDAS